jgi:hypothetical protein
MLIYRVFDTVTKKYLVGGTHKWSDIARGYAYTPRWNGKGTVWTNRTSPVRILRKLGANAIVNCQLIEYYLDDKFSKRTTMTELFPNAVAAVK